MKPKQTKLAAVTRELRRIAKSNGGVLQPATVVDAARPKSSPLHSKFEWDDSAAAEAYRIWQARQLIKVCVEVLPGVSVPTEVFVSLSSDRCSGGGYRVTTTVLSDAETRAELLEDALAELRIFKIKYRRLTELASVFDAIDRAERKRRK